jgi:iron complex outermembrane receptor protein
MSTYPATPVLRLVRGLNLILASLVLGSAIPGAYAAADNTVGTIVGSVSNAATGANLEGAQITLQPGNIAVLSTRDGHFTLPRIQPGSYRLSVSYAGLDPKTVSVDVRAGATAQLDVDLNAEVYRLAQFVVAGEREGNALAITQQRNADNIKNVISSDAFGDVADLNLGNFMQRLPGVSKEESEGEIFKIQIRGINSNLSAVSVDGTRASNGSTRSMDRGFEIDKVPTDFIETIEVTKAMTPDTDADSIGGAVNLRTKSALDRKGRRINYQFGNTYNVSQKSFRPTGSVGYSDLILGGKVGLLFTASYNESHKPRDSNNIAWERTTVTNRPAWFTGNSFGQDQLKHKRAGLGVRIDYKFSEVTRVYFNTTYSLYEDQLNRRWGQLAFPTQTQILNWSDTVTESRNQPLSVVQLLRDRDVNTLNFQVGGESTVWGGKLDFNANHSPSKGTEWRFIPTQTIGTTTAGPGFRMDRSVSKEWLTIRQISGPDINDPRNSLLSVETQDYASDDKITGAQVNFRRPFRTALPFAFKTGARYRAQTRAREQERGFFEYVGPNGTRGPVGATNDDDLGRFLDPGYTYLPAGMIPLRWLKLPELETSLRGSPQLWSQNVFNSVRDSVRFDSKAEETVTSLYAMGDLRIGRLGIVSGVRMEDTRVTARGKKQELTREERARRTAWGTAPVTAAENTRRALAEYDNTVTAKGGYRDYFPSIHFKYDLTRNLVARVSYSTGIGRPNFGQIVPDMTINVDNETITSNNPDLKPQYSTNYDATLEYYFQPAGLASIAVFEKNIKEFIFRGTAGTVEPGSIFGDAYNGYLLTTDQNGGSARVRGLEVSFQQQFSNLPGFWKGFGAFTNFTWLETEGDYGTPGQTLTQRQLPNFTPRSGNVGISYIAYGWTMRVKATHTGDRLAVYNADPSRMIFGVPHTPVDVNLAYSFSQRLRVYIDAINVFNVGSQSQYQYISDRRSRTDRFTTLIKFGFSGNF